MVVRALPQPSLEVPLLTLAAAVGRVMPLGLVVLVVVVRALILVDPQLLVVMEQRIRAAAVGLLLIQMQVAQAAQAL
jgi:hypothetical protein